MRSPRKGLPAEKLVYRCRELESGRNDGLGSSRELHSEPPGCSVDQTGRISLAGFAAAGREVSQDCSGVRLCDANRRGT